MTQRTHTETVLTAPEDKPGFVVYYSIYEEVIKKLDDHQIANLFRAMLSTGGVCEMPTLDPLTDMAFGPILRGMKENDERWLKTKYARAENGRKGGLQRAKNERKRKEAEAKASTLEKAQAPSCTLEANQANQAVIGKGNVIVKGNVEGKGNNTPIVQHGAQSAPVAAGVCSADAERGGGLSSSRSPTKKEVNAHFEALWALYPAKRGKNKVTESTRRNLFAVSTEEMQRAIDRYKAEVEAANFDRNWLNGSTWFNGRWEDYAGDAYEPLPQHEAKPSTRSRQVQPYAPGEAARRAAYFASVEE